jgi:hypothetical protein
MERTNRILKTTKSNRGSKLQINKKINKMQMKQHCSENTAMLCSRTCL